MISTSIASAWSRRASTTLVAGLVLALMTAPGLGAQSSALLSARRGFASRADLEVAAVMAERISRTSSDKKERERKAREATMIRERLREGDFQPGHRIFLDVVSDSALSDTFTVRSDRKLLLPNLPEVSLVGVLDSELQDYLTKEIARYIKNPTVRATGLLRLSITGSVGRPGFYSLPMDAPVSDAIMFAGGPNGTADLHKITVRRGDAVALEADVMDDALRQGYTLSDVGMRPGDELEIGSNTKGGWLTAGTIARAFLAAVFPIVYILRRF